MNALTTELRGEDMSLFQCHGSRLYLFIYLFICECRINCAVSLMYTEPFPLSDTGSYHIAEVNDVLKIS